MIVGASRGLGGSLVSKCLANGQMVIGIGRTNEYAIKNRTTWNKTGRFRYLQADVGNPKSIDVLKTIAENGNCNPMCVIFNAAVIDSDVGHKGNLKLDIFKKINNTGIDGFSNVLEGFSEHLVSHGGMLVGISSFSAWIPPMRGNKVAYPASKAYLDMALRSLRLLWNKKVHVMTVHLGHLEYEAGTSWFSIPYDNVAEKIIKATLCNRPPENISMPRLYRIAYKILRLMPDRVVSISVGLLNGLMARILPGKS